jgi:hypothetical protein
MHVKRVGWVAAMISTMAFQSGCSALFVHGPPANHAELASFECSDSNAWPVVDTIWAGLNGLGAASAAGDDANPDQDQIVLVGVTWLVISGASAIYGFSKVAACHDARGQRVFAPAEAPSLAASRTCRDERYRAIVEARKERDPRERMRLINEAPVCPEPAATGPTPAAPAPAAPAPAAQPPAGVPAPQPTSSRAWPARARRSLAMRPALATD